jgi:hypothetical protein
MPATVTGVAFTNHLADRSVAYNRILENGSGVALGDIDGDGDCDLYFCRLEGSNALYRNLGDWRFEEIAVAAGVLCPDQYSTGAVFADIDGDDDADLLVNSIGGGTRAFLNDGGGTFSELTGTRLVRRFGSTSLALADIDADRDLDLYVANYRTDTYRDRPAGLKVEARRVAGRIVVTPEDRFVPLMPRGGGVEVLELGERDFLYLNDGKGRFAPVSWTTGSFVDEAGRPLTEPPRDWGLSVMFRDFNRDGSPDIYVCNDFFHSPDRIWIGEQSRRFRALPPTAMRHMSLSSMAVDFADFNRDGADDFFVVDMLSRSHLDRQRQRPNMLAGLVSPPIWDPEFRPEVPRNTLFLNRGDDTFAEIGQLSGLAATEWSWGVVFLDVDLDGYEDVLVATGNRHDVQDADALRQVDRIRDAETPEARLSRFPRLETPNLAFRNRGDLVFEDLSGPWGFDLVGVTHGMACADLDNDGDLDVVLNNLNAAAALYRNETSAPRVAVRLKGRPPNTRGVGARIFVKGGAVPCQDQEMLCGGRYLSCDDTVRTFAASDQPMRIEVVWPAGRRSVIESATGNRLYEIAEGGAALEPPRPVQVPVTWFEDSSHLIDHRHVDEPFDDFARQPLLPRQMSNLGPGVAWVDLDQDGVEDLVIGSGRGGHLALFRNTGRGAFTRVPPGAPAPVLQDQTAILGWIREATNVSLIVGSSNYETGPNAPSAILLQDARGLITRGIEVQGASIGPLCLSDIDLDGDLDLFAGGRVSPGRYPEPVSSMLFRNDRGRFVEDPENSRALENAGMVSGAVFSDIDGDGDGDLILACEWGPLRILRNELGSLVDVTHSYGMDRHRGWWTAVAMGDFDGDGRLDILAANWGRNNKYHPVLARPLPIYYHDFDQDGFVEVIEALFDATSGKIVPWRDFDAVSRALPFVRQRIHTFREYGRTSVSELLGAEWPRAKQLTASTLDSMIFMNRGDRFEPRALPDDAQFAPAFGVAVADFDGDGHEDAVLAQSFFGTDPETGRCDSGRGLLLRGDGRGGFTVIPGQTSGIRAYGEQRGCAVADYDTDGRVDVVITQSGGPTRLFRNRRAAPGVRVILRGPPDNPGGVGAVIRIQREDRLGPAREVHAGAGYWSQDGLIQVLSVPGHADAVRVRWQGGMETTTALTPDAREIEIAWPGRAE